MRLVRFSDEFLPQAAEILADRHGHELAIFSELPSEFATPSFAMKALESEWRRPDVVGSALLNENNRLVGYMIGHSLIDTFWGRSGWVRYPGMGLASGLSEELYRNLYADMASPWVRRGCFKHFAFVPAGNPALIDAWFRLGFTYQQAYALLDFEHEAEDDFKAPSGVTVRPAETSDAQALRTAAEWICTHQAQSPGWNPILPEVLGKIREGYAGIVNDTDADLWVAVRDGEIVGFHAYWPIATSEADMIIPKNCIELKVAAVKPGERGIGIGRALVSHCFRELRSRGYRFCTADWAILNLLSSVYWPRRGFRPVMYRLARHVDERVAWANGSRMC